MPDNTLRALLEDVWDDGNAAGLDGWVGPGRGTEQVDEDAILRRGRATKNALANLAGWRPAARVIETVEELEAAPAGSVVVSNWGRVWVRDRVAGHWWSAGESTPYSTAALWRYVGVGNCPSASLTLVHVAVVPEVVYLEVDRD